MIKVIEETKRYDINGFQNAEKIKISVGDIIDFDSERAQFKVVSISGNTYFCVPLNQEAKNIIQYELEELKYDPKYKTFDLSKYEDEGLVGFTKRVLALLSYAFAISINKNSTDGKDYHIYTLSMDIAVKDGDTVKGLGGTGSSDNGLWEDLCEVLEKHGYEMAGDLLNLEDNGRTDIYKDNDSEYFID